MDNDYHDYYQQDQKQWKLKPFITFSFFHRILLTYGHLLINFEQLLKVQQILVMNDLFLPGWHWDLIQLFHLRKEIKNYHHVQLFIYPIVKVFYKFISLFINIYHPSVEHRKWFHKFKQQQYNLHRVSFSTYLYLEKNILLSIYMYIVALSLLVSTGMSRK